MPTPHRRLSDPRDLSALAHPVRLAIVELLSVAGPLTATELADRIEESPANCSWHLRKLAEHGFVVEAGGGTGRQRPWKVPGLGFSWNEGGSDQAPEQRRAGAALSQVMMQRTVARLHEAQERLPDEPTAWREATSSVETATWLTADELAAMNADITAVIDRYAERLTDPTARPDGSRLCEFVAWGIPTYFPGVDPR